ncbi:hypothetical protein GCM10027203_41710 [Nonomuraea fastidiosa]
MTNASPPGVADGVPGTGSGVRLGSRLLRYFVSLPGTRPVLPAAEPADRVYRDLEPDVVPTHPLTDP